MGIAFDAVRTARNMSEKKESTVSSVAVFLFIVVVGAGVITTGVTHWPGWGIGGIVIGLYLLLSLKVADQWNKAAVLRLGKYKGLRGPGMFFIIPVVDRISGF